MTKQNFQGLKVLCLSVHFRLQSKHYTSLKEFRFISDQGKANMSKFWRHICLQQSWKLRTALHNTYGRSNNVWYKMIWCKMHSVTNIWWAQLLIYNQNVKLTTRWASVHGYASICCDLHVWPFELISVSPVQVHTWHNYGDNIYGDIESNPFLGSLPVPPVTLTFDSWSQSYLALHTCTNSNTSVTKIGWNSLHWIVWYDVHKIFKLLPAVTLRFDLWPN